MRGELVVYATVEKELAIVSGVIKMPIRRQQEGGQRARKKRRTILRRVISRSEKESLVLDERPAKRAGALFQRIGNIYRIDRRECRRRDATRHGRWAKAFGRERLGLPAAGAKQIKPFAVKVVRARFGDDVQRGA